MNKHGVSLIEVMIVVSIIGILAIALGFSYQGWMGGYKVEKQIKELHTDLMQARAQAMERKRSFFVDLAATTYSVYEDTSPAPDGNGILETAADTRRINKTFEVGKQIVWNGAGSRIEFITRGLSSNLRTICSSSGIDADYNCIVVAASRINLGKLTGNNWQEVVTDPSKCTEVNCATK